MDDNLQRRRVGGLLKRLGIAYLRGIDAMIRGLGTCVIVWIFYGIMWAVVRLLVRLPFGESAAATIFPVAALVLTPFVIRYGILAGGFEIPPVWKSKKRREQDGLRGKVEERC